MRLRRVPNTPAPSADRSVLEVKDIYKHYITRGLGQSRPRARVHALDGVSLTVSPGETLGIVGESGCGKSTLGRIAAGLCPPSSGEVRTNGGLQAVFQNPAASLDPRWTIAASMTEPLRKQERRARRAAVADMLAMVQLSPDLGKRLPHELSGGQQQRACIGRALIANPQLVVLDESLSALDVSLQAQILELLVDLRNRLNVAYLFISHDLAVVREISHRVGVLYLGKICEIAPADTFSTNPLHPYSYALQASSPVADPAVERVREHILLRGDVPTPTNPPSGCRFRTRCPFANEICAKVEPPLRMVGNGHLVACHFPGIASEQPWLYTEATVSGAV